MALSGFVRLTAAAVVVTAALLLLAAPFVLAVCSPFLGR